MSLHFQKALLRLPVIDERLEIEVGSTGYICMVPLLKLNIVLEYIPHFLSLLAHPLFVVSMN